MAQNKKLHIAVLMGGISNERAVSLKSGEAVASALAKRGHRVTKIDIKEKKIDALVRADPDVAFIALHGEFGEDGQVQTMLEDVRIPYTGSRAPAARIGMDKAASKNAFIRASVPTPSYTIVSPETSRLDLIRKAEELGFPLVCKPTIGGSSIDVNIVKNPCELTTVMKKHQASAAAGSEEERTGKMMLEEYIHGRELTVGILDDEPLPVVEIAPSGGFFDFRAKYEDDSTVYKVPVSLIESVYRKVCDIAVRAGRATGCRHMSRVDIMYGYDGGVYVLELNTIPGLTSRSLLPMAASYAGIEFSELCERICMLTWQEAVGLKNGRSGSLRKIA